MTLCTKCNGASRGKLVCRNCAGKTDGMCRFKGCTAPHGEGKQLCAEHERKIYDLLTLAPMEGNHG